MPRDTSIQEIASLTTKALPLLYQFRHQAQIEISRTMRVDPKKISMFMSGFHAIPKSISPSFPCEELDIKH